MISLNNHKILSIGLRYLLLFSAIIYPMIYLVLAIIRIQYPFELEWIEGSMVDHVRRILAGKGLYASPSLEFVSCIYTPLYFYLSAIVSKICGVGFLPLRLISFVSSLCNFFMIFLIVKRETEDRFSGIVASGLFAATFQISGAWFDIARVDSLFLLFLLASIYTLRFYSSIRSTLIASLLISLSFLTKQTALVAIIPMTLYYLFQNRRRLFILTITTVGLILCSTIILNFIYDGWYTYYVYELPRYHQIHEIDLSRFYSFWTIDIWDPLAIAAILCITYLLIQFLKKDNKIKDNLFYFFFALGFVGASYISRLNEAAYSNVLIPAYAALSILFGLAIHSIMNIVSQKRLLKMAFYLCCIIQFTNLMYNPRSQLPTQKDADAGHKFIMILSQFEGEIFILNHGFLSHLAGKNTFAHAMAMRDIIRGKKHSPIKNKIIKDLKDAIRKKKFDAIILDSSILLHYFIHDLIQENYVKDQDIFQSDDVFWPVTGHKTRPEIIYTPKERILE